MWKSLQQASPRVRRFTVASGVVYLLSLAVVSVLAVLVDERGETPALLGGLIGTMVGTPIAIALASLLCFGWSGRVRPALAMIGLGWIVTLGIGICFGNTQPLLHGTRWLMRGSEHGTVAAIARSRASYVSVSPALVDLSRLGSAFTTSTDDEGRTSTTWRHVAPILTVLGERDPDAMAAEPIHLFLCDDDASDLRAHGPGDGTISGRVAAPDPVERLAIADLGDQVRLATPHRCITLTYAGGTATGLFWLVLAIVIAVLGAIAGATTVFVHTPH